jgi:leucyl aminopeptidase
MFKNISIVTRGKPKTVVVGQFQGEGLDADSAGVDPAGWSAWAASKEQGAGDLGKVVQVFCPEGPERVLVVGLGPRDGFKPGALRAAAAAVGRHAAGAKIESLHVALTDAIATLVDADVTACGRQFGEGLGIVSWNYDTLRGSATPDAERGDLSVRFDTAEFAQGAEAGLGFAEGCNTARTLSQTPPNIATPDYIAQKAKELAKDTGLKCTVIKGKKLEDERLIGLINVGKASENEPCLVRLEYTPKGPDAQPGAKPVVLIGKTMTYDSGGLSIKISGGMRGMKRDKDGGCGIFGAMQIIAKVVKPSFPVVALLSCAENAISDEAYRPDDVIEFRNGVTVEVTNTDAEGRLVLADAMCWACDVENPRCMIDMATLTGGVVVALGSAYAGIWCDDDDLRSTIEAAGTDTGERVWRLPHDDAYRNMMKSPIADIHNSAPVREAHPIQGAAFLSYFCKDGIPWAHIDIAGTHATDKDAGPFIPGPTGFGARLVADAVQRMDAR